MRNFQPHFACQSAYGSLSSLHRQRSNSDVTKELFMSTFTYTAVDPQGRETKGALQIADQSEAIQRIKEMGFYPTRVTQLAGSLSPAERTQKHARRLGLTASLGKPI